MTNFLILQSTSRHVLLTDSVIFLLTLPINNFVAETMMESTMGETLEHNMF